MTVNMDLVNEIFTQIRANPSHWDQLDWAIGEIPADPDSDEPSADPASLLQTCGTKFCFAGWAVMLKGLLKFELDGGPILGDENCWVLVMAPNEYGIEIADAAMNLLGLDHDVADEIFYDLPGNDIDEFEHKIRELIA